MCHHCLQTAQWGGMLYCVRVVRRCCLLSARRCCSARHRSSAVQYSHQAAAQPRRASTEPGSEANIIKKKDKLLDRLIPYLKCKIWNKDTKYVVLLSTTYWAFLFHILHVIYGIKRPNSLSFFLYNIGFWCQSRTVWTVARRISVILSCLSEWGRFTLHLTALLC